MHNISYNLIDTTFLIYVRIDSEDRLINLELVLKHLLKYFDVTIFLLEVDITPKITSEFINKYGVEYEFVKDANEVFHTTKYRNYLVHRCKTPYFFICDTDIIVAPEAMIKSQEYLINFPSEKILVYPYNGDFYNISKQCREAYALTNDYKFLKENEKEHLLWFKYSTGGVFGGKTIVFKNFDIDNEKIYGWGPDDKERYYRLKRKGFKIKREDYPLYHLWHQRNRNSKPSNEHVKNENQLEYLKIFTPDFNL